MVKGQAGRGKVREVIKKVWSKVKGPLKSSRIISKGLEKLTSMAATRAGAEIAAKTGIANAGPVAATVVQAIGDRVTDAVRQRGYGKARKSKIIGTRRQVFNGSMMKTSGGLTKTDLMLNKRGRIVSKKKHLFGVSKGRKFLADAGYEPKKGSFKLFAKKS